MNDGGKNSFPLPLLLFRSLRAPDVTTSDLSLPPSPTEATAAGQSPPFHPDCSFLEGEREGVHSGCGLGKSGACGSVVPFPDVCSW